MGIKTLNDNVMVCTDCAMVICNDDVSGIEDDYQIDAVYQGIDEAQGHFALGDSDKDLEHSISSCACCGSDAHGKRHHFTEYEVLA